MAFLALALVLVLSQSPQLQAEARRTAKGTVVQAIDSTLPAMQAARHLTHQFSSISHHLLRTPGTLSRDREPGDNKMKNPMLPMLFVVLAATPAAHAQGIKHFLNFSRAIGKEISITDRNGFIREGIVEAVTADQVTLRIGATTESFPRTVVSSADRVKDERVDGAVKGALLGLLGLAVSYQGCGTTECSFWKTAIRAGALGYLIDAAESHPQPLYRGPLAPASPLKVTFRF